MRRGAWQRRLPARSSSPNTLAHPAAGATMTTRLTANPHGSSLHAELLAHAIGIPDLLALRPPSPRDRRARIAPDPCRRRRRRGHGRRSAAAGWLRGNGGLALAPSARGELRAAYRPATSPMRRSAASIAVTPRASRARAFRAACARAPKATSIVRPLEARCQRASTCDEEVAPWQRLAPACAARARRRVATRRPCLPLSRHASIASRRNIRWLCARALSASRASASANASSRAGASSAASASMPRMSGPDEGHAGYARDAKRMLQVVPACARRPVVRSSSPRNASASASKRGESIWRASFNACSACSSAASNAISAWLNW